MTHRMKRALFALSFFVLTAGAVCSPAQLQQVHPFRDGTPGVTGYRSEVLNSSASPKPSPPKNTPGVPRPA